jgi:hypothetical protein
LGRIEPEPGEFDVAWLDETLADAFVTDLIDAAQLEHADRFARGVRAPCGTATPV